MKIERPNWLKYSLQYARAGFESKVLKRKPIFLTVFVTSRCALTVDIAFIEKICAQWKYPHRNETLGVRKIHSTV